MLRSLGSGGGGNVYLAEDTKLRRKVALKILHGASAGVDEARCSSLLNHPNIVMLLDFGMIDGLTYLVTEYVEGKSLRRRLSEGPLPLTEALEIGIGVANALTAAHEAWIVHRDIKPENIMLRRKSEVKILDFGVAALTEPHPAVDPLRVAGKISGTLQYLSPEQVRGDDIIDSRSDLFSLGIVLYEMVAGAPPFTGAKKVDLLANIVEGEPPPLPSHLPVTMHEIIGKSLRKAIHERYQMAADFARDLSNLRLDLLLSERASRSM